MKRFIPHLIPRLMSRALLSALCLCFLATGARAQSDSLTGRYYFLDEGTSGQQGSVGFVGLPCGIPTVIDSIGNFGTALFAHGNWLFAAEGSGPFSSGAGKVYVIDRQTAAIVDTIDSVAARNFAVWNDTLLSVNDQPPFLRGFDLTNGFAEVLSIDTALLQNEAAGLVVRGDTAFVSVNGFNGFGLNGIADTTLAVIDLRARDTLAMLDVGMNPGEVEFAGGRVVVQSRLPFGSLPGQVAVVVDPATLSILRSDTLQTTNGTNWVSSTDSVFFQAMSADSNQVFYAYDPVSGALDSLAPAEAFYRLHRNAASGRFFASQSDFTTTGVLRYTTAGGGLSDSLLAGIAPRGLFWDAATDSFPGFPVSLSGGQQNGDTLVAGTGPFSAVLTDTLANLDYSWQITNTTAGAQSFSGPGPHSVSYPGGGASPDSTRFILSASFYGCPQADTLTFAVRPQTLGREGQLAAASVSLYPVPARQELTLALPATGPLAGTLPAEVRVYDLQGRRMRVQRRRISPHRIQLDINELPAGAYLLRLPASASIGEPVNLRFLKQ